VEILSFMSSLLESSLLHMIFFVTFRMAEATHYCKYKLNFHDWIN
jgi:hypothetical protein